MELGLGGNSIALKMARKRLEKDLKVHLIAWFGPDRIAADLSKSDMENLIFSELCGILEKFEKFFEEFRTNWLIVI